MTWKRQFDRRLGKTQSSPSSQNGGLRDLVGRARKSSITVRLFIGGAALLAVLTPVLAFAWSNQSERAHTFIADDGYNTDAFVAPSNLDLQVESSAATSGQADDTSNLQNSTASVDDSTEISLQATVTDDSAELQLNGQDVSMGQSGGSMRKTFESSNGTTTVDISIKNDGSNSSSSNIEISNSSSVHSNSNNDDDRHDVDARRYR